MQLATNFMKIAAGIALMLRVTMAAPVVPAIERALEEAPIWSSAASLTAREHAVLPSQLANVGEALERRICGYVNGHYACSPLGGHPRDVDAEIKTRVSDEEHQGTPGGPHHWSAHFGSPEDGLRRSEGQNDHDTAFLIRDRNDLKERSDLAKRSVEGDIPNCRYDVFGVLRCN